jgi:hypothetical protein
MTYVVRGLDPAHFAPLYHSAPEALARSGAQRVTIDAPNSAPCRILLDDLAPGETALLLSFEHQPAATPYRQQGPIFIGERADPMAAVYENEVPPALGRRPLSVRAFNPAGMMVDADLTDGARASELFERMLAHADVAYIHAHYARRGCFAARIDRA